MQSIYPLLSTRMIVVKDSWTEMLKRDLYFNTFGWNWWLVKYHVLTRDVIHFLQFVIMNPFIIPYKIHLKSRFKYFFDYINWLIKSYYRSSLSMILSTKTNIYHTYLWVGWNYSRCIANWKWINWYLLVKCYWTITLNFMKRKREYNW